MNPIQICNIVAWVLCGVVGFILFGDFIRTEIKAFKDSKKEEGGTEE